MDSYTKNITTYSISNNLSDIISNLKSACLEESISSIDETIDKFGIIELILNFYGLTKQNAKEHIKNITAEYFNKIISKNDVSSLIQPYYPYLKSKELFSKILLGHPHEL